MVAPTTLADLVRPPVSSFIWYMVYSSFRWEGLNPSISGMAREMMTPDEVRSMDNRCALLFIRGEKPVMDEKYDLLRHPNLRRTADGGAAPYVHKAADYACGDMRGAFVSLEELILLEGFTE
mgnify:CR=1 FL=1